LVPPLYRRLNYPAGGIIFYQIIVKSKFDKKTAVISGFKIVSCLTTTTYAADALFLRVLVFLTTLPAFKHDVQTVSRLGVPSTKALTF
jgi:hypothetical protein